MKHMLFVLMIGLVTLSATAQNKIEGAYKPELFTFEITDTTYWADFVNDGLALIYKDGYTGLMDSIGTILIEPKYDKIFPFEGELAKFSLNARFGFINRQGKVVRDTFTRELQPFVNGYAVYKIPNKNKFGIVLKNGNTLNKQEYDYLEALNDDRFVFVRENTIGLLKTDGKELKLMKNVNFRDLERKIHLSSSGPRLSIDNLKQLNVFHFTEGLAPSFEWNDDRYKFGFMNNNGKVVIEPRYDWVEAFHKGYAVVHKEDQLGLINKLGEVILPCKFRSVAVMSETRILISQKNGYNVMSSDGKEVITTSYDSIMPIGNGQYIVSHDNDMFGVINEVGKVIIPFKYPYLSYLFDDLLLTRNSKYWGVINLSGKRILPFKYDGIVRTGEHIGEATRHISDTPLNTGVPRYVYHGEKVSIDSGGEIKGTTHSFHQTIEGISDLYFSGSGVFYSPSLFGGDGSSFFGIQPVKQTFSTEWHNPTKEVEPKYRIITKKKSVNADNSMVFQYPMGRSSNAGVLSILGDTLIPADYEWIDHQNKNFFVVRKNQKCGVIGITGEVIIPIQYPSIRSIEGGFIVAQKKMMRGNKNQEYYNWEYSIFDVRGNVLLPFQQTEFRETGYGTLMQEEENYYHFYMIDRKGNRLKGQ